MGEYRVELAGFSEGMLDRLKAIGLVTEIIAWKLRLFVPMRRTGPEILSLLMTRHPPLALSGRAAA